MGNIRAAFSDLGKNIFTPKAFLTGGASLAVSGTRAAMKKPGAPTMPAPLQGTSAPGGGAAGGTGSSATVGGGAPGGTLLTGPGGVDRSLLNLGKNTLLGQ